MLDVVHALASLLTRVVFNVSDAFTASSRPVFPVKMFLVNCADGVSAAADDGEMASDHGSRTARH